MVYFLALTAPLRILGLLAINRTGIRLSTIQFEAAALGAILAALSVASQVISPSN